MIDTPDSQSSSAQGHQEVYQASAPWDDQTARLVHNSQWSIVITILDQQFQFKYQNDSISSKKTNC